jgi:hypothetical protein
MNGYLTPLTNAILDHEGTIDRDDHVSEIENDRISIRSGSLKSCSDYGERECPACELAAALRSTGAHGSQHLKAGRLQ